MSHFRKKVDSSSCPQLVGRGNLVASGKNEAITTFGCNRFWRISTAQGFVLKPFQSNIKGNRDVSAFYLREGRLYQIGWDLGALNRTLRAWNWYKRVISGFRVCFFNNCIEKNQNKTHFEEGSHCYIKCPFLGLGASFGQFSSNGISFHHELIFAMGLEF